MNDAEKIARAIAGLSIVVYQDRSIFVHRLTETEHREMIKATLRGEGGPDASLWSEKFYANFIAGIIAPLVQERDELESKQFVPGAWVCPKCNFTCFKNILYAQSGNIGPDTTSHFEICPNDMERMQRLSWKDHCEGMASQLENRIKDNTELRAQLEKANRLALATHGLVGYCWSARHLHSDNRVWAGGIIQYIDTVKAPPKIRRNGRVIDWPRFAMASDASISGVNGSTNSRTAST